jgi:hypothetical protein
MNPSDLKKTWIYYTVTVISIALIVRTLLIVYQYKIVPLYWDQWISVVDYLGYPTQALTLKYIFQAHNEHVIATAKILFFLDYYYLHFINGPLVLAVVVSAILMAILVSILFFAGQRKGVLFWTVLSVLTASSLSMVQWQNLVWGFQQPFYLVNIGAVLSVLCAAKVCESKDTLRHSIWFIALLFSIAFCVFSLGNGVAIPMSVLMFLTVMRYRLLPSLVIFAFGAGMAYVAICLTKAAPSFGDTPSRTPLHLIPFFFTVIGSPLSSDLNRALGAGIGISLLNAWASVTYVIKPWLRGKPADKIMAALFSLGTFLLASAAAASYGRISLGLGGALASRYSTPMLLLIMTTALLYLRFATITSLSSKKTSKVTAPILVTMLLVAGFTSLRSDNAVAYTTLYKAVTSAAYFVASGVDDENQLKELNPSVAVISSYFETLRNRKLNIFADYGGLPMPTASDILQVADLPADRVCDRSAIESVSPLPGQQWKVAGWATNASGLTPTWIFAFDHNKRLLGFTKPLEAGPEGVEDSLTHTPLKGFLLPVGTTDLSERNISVSIAYGGTAPPCVIPMPELPTVSQ